MLTLFSWYYQVWEVATVQCIQILEGHTNVVMDLLCWEQFLISCSLDGTIKVRYMFTFLCSFSL